MNLSLSILDFGVSWGYHSCNVLSETVKLATIADRLGYRRYWLTEHHSQKSAWSSPEIILPAILAQTKVIRVGTAGVLMHFHRPLKVASSFHALTSLFPGRVDLGLAAGMPNQIEIRQALVENFDDNQAREDRLYADAVKSLLKFIQGQSGSVFDYVRIDSPLIPEVWVMGSGNRKGGMILAARFGAAFCYSGFHAGVIVGPTTIRAYREQFDYTLSLQRRPTAAIAVGIVCSDSPKDLERQVSMVLSYHPIRPFVIGSPGRCYRELINVKEKYDVDEVIVSPLGPTVDDRIRCIEQIALMDESNTTSR